MTLDVSKCGYIAASRDMYLFWVPDPHLFISRPALFRATVEKFKHFGGIFHPPGKNFSKDKDRNKHKSGIFSVSFHDSEFVLHSNCAENTVLTRGAANFLEHPILFHVPVKIDFDAFS